MVMTEANFILKTEVAQARDNHVRGGLWYRLHRKRIASVYQEQARFSNKKRITGISTTYILFNVTLRPNTGNLTCGIVAQSLASKAYEPDIKTTEMMPKTVQDALSPRIWACLTCRKAIY
jgi:hypothetical protein